MRMKSGQNESHVRPQFLLGAQTRTILTLTHTKSVVPLHKIAHHNSYSPTTTACVSQSGDPPCRPWKQFTKPDSGIFVDCRFVSGSRLNSIGTYFDGAMFSALLEMRAGSRSESRSRVVVITNHRTARIHRTGTGIPQSRALTLMCRLESCSRTTAMSTTSLADEIPQQIDINEEIRNLSFCLVYPQKKSPRSAPHCPHAIFSSGTFSRKHRYDHSDAIGGESPSMMVGHRGDSTETEEASRKKDIPKARKDSRKIPQKRDRVRAPPGGFTRDPCYEYQPAGAAFLWIGAPWNEAAIKTF